MAIKQPPFFYRFMRGIARYATGVYFFDMQRVDFDKVPDDEPIILAANHPRSLMDTVVLAALTERQVCYMGRAGLFHKHPIVPLILNNVGVIPIYRSEDLKRTNAKNEDAFYRAYQVLENRGCIGIFPEGHNSPEKQVGELKTGTARIALHTEARNAFELGVKIIPVGLNYHDQERFLRRVLLRFGEPIDTRQYGALYQEDERTAVRTLTNDLQTALRDIATHVEDDRNTELLNDVYKIYGNELTREFLGDLDDVKIRPFKHRLLNRARFSEDPQEILEDRFLIEKHIARAIDHYQRTDPGLVARVRMDIRRYKDHLAQVRLKHEILEEGFTGKGRKREALKLTLYAILLGPFAIYGLINNAIPYAIVRYSHSQQKDERVELFAVFLTGLVFFPLFYFLQAWALWTLTDQTIWAVIVYLISLPITGFFHLRWWRQILAYRNKILSRTLFRSEKSLVVALQNDRDNLVNTFETLKERYLEAWRDRRLEPSQEIPLERSIRPTERPEFISLEVPEEQPAP